MSALFYTRKVLMIEFSLKEVNVTDVVFQDADFWSRWDSLPPMFPESFFTESAIIRAWLKNIPDDVYIFISEVFMDGNVAGVCLFGKKKETIKRFFKCEMLTLLRSGDDDADQTWPEYVMPRCLPELVPLWSEWMLNVIKAANVNAMITEVIPVTWGDEWLQQSKNLTSVKTNIERGAVLDLRGALVFSSSIKRQLKQTTRYAQERYNSVLSLHEVHDIEKQDIVMRHNAWHRKKWAGTSTPSGFENPSFFSTIKEWVKSDAIKVFVAEVDGQVLGFNIVLTQGKWAGYYLSSLAPGESNHWHVGVWMHVQIAQCLQREGYNFYDFMAGDARYKTQLVKHSGFERDYARFTWFNSKKLKSKLLSRLM
jgi:hypothetical protein